MKTVKDLDTKSTKLVFFGEISSGTTSFINAILCVLL